MNIAEIFEKPANEEGDLMKGFVAGIVGGVLGSLVMEQFQALWSKSEKAIEHWQSDEDEEEAKPRRGRKSQPATVKAAQTISENVFGRKLPRSRKRLAGEAVHYAMGASSGAIYGMAAEALPVTTAADGLAFGTAVWLLADEVSVPALGLSKSPRKIPLKIHLYALVSHLVYGCTTELVRRAVRNVL